MLAHSDSIVPAQKANSRNTTKYNLRQASLDENLFSLEEKIEEYFQKHPEKLKTLENSEPEHIDSLPTHQRYKPRRWAGHSYGVNLIIHTAYLFQAYHFAYGVEGKPIYPSKKTLAEEVGICIRTLDKALKILKEMGIISWKSGQTTWETNVYYLVDTYKSTPMRKPSDFTHPRHLWLKQQYLIKKQKLKEFTKTIYEHLIRDIADYLLRKNKKIRTPQEKRRKNILKVGTDPPNPQKKPPHWHLLKDLKLHFKDQWVLSRYSECLIRAAMDDLNSYQSWGKSVKNVAAFLVSRCKDHEKQNEMKKSKPNPDNIKEWLTIYFKERKKRFLFISNKNQIDRTKSEHRPFIQLLWHKDDFKKSVLKVYQKVEGTWIDKVFRFDRPNLVDSIHAYLETSL
jgi:hypothetical protein